MWHRTYSKIERRLTIMTHKKASKSKIFTLLFSFIMCATFISSIAMASLTKTVYAADTTQIDTLGVAFRKVEVGDTLDAAFEFENATTKTLKVPVGANYTATLVSVSKNGQGIKLWDNDDTLLPWSRVETQYVEQNVAYCVRVRFKTNDGYKFVRDLPRLKNNMQVLGAELGKGKDIEIWDTAGINSIATIVYMSFLITKGMTYIGNMQTIYPEIGKSVTGTIGIAGVDTGFCISGAPGPYTYEAKIAPIGTEIQTSNVFDKSNCYYQITAVNSMDYGTMYITATAADGKTCDIPVRIAAISGGHEHTWSDFGKIDFEYHGYRKCTDPACPGIAHAFDTGSQYAAHEFIGECTEKCTKCGNLDNPNANHDFGDLVAETPATCDGKAVCSVCGEAYGEKLGHDWGEVKYTWMSDSTCKAERICKHDSSHIESETVTATETIITAATCKEKGKMKYTATFVNTAFSMQEREIDIDFAEHDFDTLIPEVSPTTTEFGVKEHKDCKVCGKHFDKDGNEITELRIAKIGTYNVVINGESEFYDDGESITVTAKDKEGKKFKGWQDESGKIISTDKNYTFTVTRGMTLTAIYEDVLSVKKGLSSGQITGIVIGSVAVAGIGAFSIFWFAVKKKSFADLGFALKNCFMAIGKFFKNLGAKIKSLFTKKK